MWHMICLKRICILIYFLANLNSFEVNYFFDPKLNLQKLSSKYKNNYKITCVSSALKTFTKYEANLWIIN